MDGSEVFKFATRKVPENMLEVINQSGLSKEDIKPLTSFGPAVK